MKIVKIGNRSVGENQPALIIAEVGVNHNGSIERGFELIDKAANSGADAVNFKLMSVTITTKKAERYWSNHLILIKAVSMILFQNWIVWMSKGLKH